ncbi:MAG: hypothetical protein H0W50_02620 [Parachlamydiaceae bacterium]|nr:hypothetical protein [Parachlamydiaceae bacterium]
MNPFSMPVCNPFDRYQNKGLSDLDYYYNAGDVINNNLNQMPDEKFVALRKQSQDDFDRLKTKYSTLFEHNGIKKVSQDKTYPSMKEIQMDEIAVIITKNQKHPSLFTSGLGVCIAVMARGISEKNGTCLGLSHFTTMIEPRDVLEKIQKKLKKEGCKPESIEFYLIGGQLPYRDGPEVGGLSTIEIESEFLSLSKEFNIIGVQFNLAEDDESLSVIISEDEIVWTVWDFKFDSNVTSSNEEESEDCEESESNCSTSKKRSRDSSSDDESFEETIKKARANVNFEGFKF